MGIRTAEVSDKAVSLRKLDMATLIMTGPSTADLEGSATHNLGRVPLGYIVVWQNKSGNVYRGVNGTAWTSTTFYAHFSAANMIVHLLLF